MHQSKSKLSWYFVDTRPVVEPDSLDEMYKSVCEKAKELPGLISADDYRDGGDTYTDPNLDAKHSAADDDVEMSEDCDVAMDMKQSTQLQSSDGEEEMEEIGDNFGSFLLRTF